MDPVTFTTIAPYLTGPASALIVTLLVIYGSFKLAKENIVPVMKEAIGRHLDQIDKMIESHEKDRTAWSVDMQMHRDQRAEDREAFKQALEKATRP